MNDRPTIQGKGGIALFDVELTHYLFSESQYIIAGEIKSGVVRAGMHIEVNLNSSIAMSLEVSGIESMRKPNRELVALIIAISSKEEAEIIDALDIAGSRLRLTTPCAHISEDITEGSA